MCREGYRLGSDEHVCDGKCTIVYLLCVYFTMGVSDCMHLQYVQCGVQ